MEALNRLWCIKCHNTDEDCTCDNDLALLQEKYEEGLGLLAKQTIRSRAINIACYPRQAKTESLGVLSGTESGRAKCGKV